MTGMMTTSFTSQDDERTRRLHRKVDDDARDGDVDAKGQWKRSVRQDVRYHNPFTPGGSGVCLERGEGPTGRRRQHPRGRAADGLPVRTPDPATPHGGGRDGGTQSGGEGGSEWGSECLATAPSCVVERVGDHA